MVSDVGPSLPFPASRTHAGMCLRIDSYVKQTPHTGPYKGPKGEPVGFLEGLSYIGLRVLGAPGNPLDIIETPASIVREVNCPQVHTSCYCCQKL